MFINKQLSHYWRPFPGSDWKNSLRADNRRLPGYEEDNAADILAYRLLTGGPQPLLYRNPTGWELRRNAAAEPIQRFSAEDAEAPAAWFSLAGPSKYFSDAAAATKRGFTSFRYRPECKCEF